VLPLESRHGFMQVLLLNFRCISFQIAVPFNIYVFKHSSLQGIAISPTKLERISKQAKYESVKTLVMYFSIRLPASQAMISSVRWMISSPHGYQRGNGQSLLYDMWTVAGGVE